MITTRYSRLNMRPHATPRLCRGSTLAWLAITAIAGAVARADSEVEHFRGRVLLNGAWEQAHAPAEQPLSEITTWSAFDVPQSWWGSPRDGARAYWARRTITIPAEWAGRRVFVRLGGAMYHPHVYLDGKLMGSQADGWSPVEVELSDAVAAGRSHELAIKCYDQAAAFAEGVPTGEAYTQDARRGKVMMLVGGYKDHPGIWDDVWLTATPQQRIVADDLVITPSVRQQTLALSGKVDGGEGDLAIEAVVLDGDRVALRLPASNVAADGAWALHASFADARYWSPEDPHLYTLQLTTRSKTTGAAIDRLEQRFGFREAWTDGPDFFLNGVKRHLLGTSHWPPTQPKSLEYIRNELQSYKDTHVNTFRPHIGGWPKAWFDLADEMGIVMIPEAPAYTDDFGMYAYQTDAFWDHYRDNVARMIRHYRNHASVVMYSLGNEILFMGNTKYDAQLPRKLGDLARYARTIDPTRPLTMEGDIDPDGAFDVIGLHYPHEMPDNHDYPNTADWMIRRKQTEAGGGMLGVTRSNFFWDRNKPLYIGEFLWCPQEDYSTATVFFGDEAYLHRERYTTASKLRGHYDQTIAYRRQGVTGMCPWGAADQPKPYYQPVAAYLHNRDNRCYSGEAYTFTYDLFNDSDRPLNLTLQLTCRDDRVPPLSRSLSLDAGGYQRITLDMVAPAVDAATPLHFDAVLLGDGQERHRTSATLTVHTRSELATPAEHSVIAFDPSGEWAGSVSTLDRLSEADAARTILIIARHALGRPATDDTTIIGGSSLDNRSLLAFLTRGGRVVVLEQMTLAPLGLDVMLVEHASTMTFAIEPGHPVLKGLAADDLKWWRGDHYVSRHQVRRPDSRGARAITVSGGPRSLDQAPIIEMPVGKGHIVFLQDLVGEKRHTEPAAARLLNNTVQYLAALPPARPGRTLVLSEDPAFHDQLRQLGVEATATSNPLHTADLEHASLLILHGGGDAIARSADAIAAYRAAGAGRIYWHAPTPDTFDALGSALRTQNLRVTPLKAGATIRQRDAMPFTGVAREDLTFLTAPVAWNRMIGRIPSATAAILPAAQRHDTIHRADLTTATLKDAKLVDRSVVFQRSGTLNVAIQAPAPGLYPLTVRAHVGPTPSTPPTLAVYINHVMAAVLFPDAQASNTLTACVELPAGESILTIEVAAGEPRGEVGRVAIEEIAVGQALEYPYATRVLTLPASIVSLDDPMPDAVVLDTTPWNVLGQGGPNELRSGRYASALLANLGAALAPPAAGPIAEHVPLHTFKLLGESPYYDASPSAITIRSNGLIEAPLTCARAGTYELTLRGHATAAAGEHGKLRVLLDGTPIGEVELRSVTSSDFKAGAFELTKGAHRLSLEFFNDASQGKDDRNIVIEAVRLHRGE